LILSLEWVDLEMSIMMGIPESSYRLSLFSNIRTLSTIYRNSWCRHPVLVLIAVILVVVVLIIAVLVIIVIVSLLIVLLIELLHVFVVNRPFFSYFLILLILHLFLLHFLFFQTHFYLLLLDIRSLFTIYFFFLLTE
jgi:hypothetical protein